MLAKTISKCISFDEFQEANIYLYTGHWNTLEIGQWWTFSLAERYKQLHETDLICLQDI